jgi:hypothetical protein
MIVIWHIIVNGIALALAYWAFMADDNMAFRPILAAACGFVLLVDLYPFIRDWTLHLIRVIRFNRTAREYVKNNALAEIERIRREAELRESIRRELTKEMQTIQPQLSRGDRLQQAAAQAQAAYNEELAALAALPLDKDEAFILGQRAKQRLIQKLSNLQNG